MIFLSKSSNFPDFHFFLMIVNIKTLKGNSYKITFKDDITIDKIKRKLLLEYNFNSEQCMFCLDGKILNDESISKEIFALTKPEITIIAIDHQVYPEKSYPKIDNAFQFNFSRYSDDFVQQNKEQKKDNRSNNYDLNDSIASISDSELNDDNDNILTTNQINEESTNDIIVNNLIQINQQETDTLSDYIQQSFEELRNSLQEINHQLQSIVENIENTNNNRNESEINMQIIESLNINIEFTEEDNQSIMRLVSAGHDRANAIQIFAICDKNEEMALNLLSTME